MPQKTLNKDYRNLIQLNELTAEEKPSNFALFALAFRPFFLLASLFSLIHLLVWVIVWLGKVTIDFPITTVTMTPFLWHGHEMVFGYAYGVIIGFLLTAVVNWTGEKTLSGVPLAMMVTMWLLARIGFFIGGIGFWVSAISDLVLSLWFIIEFTRPVIKSRNYRQMGFVSKLILLLISNSLFYLGIFGFIVNSEHYGVYLGFYLVLAIVLVMGRRIIPFFTKRALDLSEEIKNPWWLDISSIILFTLFALWDTFATQNNGLAILSLILFVLYGIRLFNWYSKGLFKKPLIWVLWLSVAIFNTGFLLKALAIWGWVYPYLFLHAFALGGIALMTLGMMSRVSLGHTGRNVFDPPKLIVSVFLLMLIAIVLRVVLPLFLLGQYKIWIMSSVSLWCLAFLIFLIIYTRMLVNSRVDGKLG